MIYFLFVDLAETGIIKKGSIIRTWQDVWSEDHWRPRSHSGTSGRRQRSLCPKQPTPSHTEKGYFWWHHRCCNGFCLLFTCIIPIQIWDILEKYDTGCTAGGGRDSINVFYDAGLLFESNLVSGTNYRKGETLCQNQQFSGTSWVHLHCTTCFQSNIIFCSNLILYCITNNNNNNKNNALLKVPLASIILELMESLMTGAVSSKYNKMSR